MKSKTKKDDSSDERIGRLDEQTMGYYRRVSDTLKDAEDNEGDKDLLMQNAFVQLCEEALVVSRNQTVSTIVETLLKAASPQQLCAFTRKFATDWETAFTDRFASHVAQTLIRCITPLLYGEVDVEDDDDLEKLGQDFGQLCRQLLVNLPLFMQHTYASHIIRTVLESLGGVTIPDALLRSRGTRKHTTDSSSKISQTRRPPAALTSLLEQFIEKVITMDRLGDYARNYLSNPVLQALLLTIKASKPTEADGITKRIVSATEMFPTCPDESEENVKIPSSCLLSDATGSWLVQQVVGISSEEFFQDLLDDHLLPFVPAMALHSSANFVLQDIIINTRNSTQLESISRKLCPIMEDILAHGHTGVAVCLAQQCLKHNTRQKKFVKSLMRACHCYEPEQRQTKCFPLFASLSAYEYSFGGDSDDSDKEESAEKCKLEPACLHGSLILQTLLKYEKTKKVTCSILAQPASYLLATSNNASGSHIFDAFFKSETITNESKNMLIKSLQGHYISMSCDKFGSRVMDSMWQNAGADQRTTIVEELANQADRLRGHQFGRFAWNKFGLQTYKQNATTWKQKFNSKRSMDTSRSQLFGKTTVRESDVSSKERNNNRKRKAKDTQQKSKKKK